MLNMLVNYYRIRKRRERILIISVSGLFASFCNFSFGKEGGFGTILYYLKLFPKFYYLLKATILKCLKQFWKY